MTRDVVWSCLRWWWWGRGFPFGIKRRRFCSFDFSNSFQKRGARRKCTSLLSLSLEENEDVSEDAAIKRRLTPSSSLRVRSASSMSTQEKAGLKRRSVSTGSPSIPVASRSIDVPMLGSVSWGSGMLKFLEGCCVSPLAMPAIAHLPWMDWAAETAAWRGL